MQKNPKSTTRIARGTAQILALVRASMSSTSRIEDRYWEQNLQQTLQKLLAAGQDPAIEAALETLCVNETEVADTLLEHAQNASQTAMLTIDGQAWQCLLMTAPLAVWTRYQLPQAALNQQAQEQLSKALRDTVLAPGVHVQLISQLLSLDEMPRSFGQIYQWQQQLGALACGMRTEPPKPDKSENNPSLLADTRHLVFAALAPVDAPLFRWQADLRTTRQGCLKDWIGQSQGALAALLPGCQFDILLPEAYHSSVQLSETHMRTVAIRSACEWLQDTLGLAAGELRATLVAVGEHEPQEWRIGFHRGQSQDVIYGTIWPLFEQQPSENLEHGIIDAGDEIAEVLKQNGVKHIKRIPGVFKPESCEDCEAPYFPNPTGELVHVELPEEAFDAPMHFH